MNVYKEPHHGKPDFPIEIYQGNCENGFYIPPHFHEEFEFLVLTQGNGVLRIDGVSQTLSQGQRAFINSESIHLGLPTGRDPVSFFAIVFSPRILGSYVHDVVMDQYVSPVVRGSLRLPTVCDGQEEWPAQALDAA